MAQKSGFFNARLVAGVYDRTYNADDYCDNLAVIISNGVLRSASDDLKVTASGLNLTVNKGRAWINGHYYWNENTYSLPAIIAPTGGTRIDRVILRFDKTITVRSITLQYLTGTAATSPVAPALTRTDTIYDLCIAEITVGANATSLSVKDTRGDADLCGWVYSVSGDNSFFTSLDNEFNEWFTDTKDEVASVTLFKQYRWFTTLETATNTVQFNIPQYDDETCFFNVYLNGILADDYTANGDVITFGTTIIAGTEVTVLAYKSIDGTGIMSVSDEITQLQNQYATLDGVTKCVYNATGTDDNISLSQIAQAFYAGSYSAGSVTTAAKNFLEAMGGNTWLASLGTMAKLTVEVVGKLGVTSAAYGSGTSTNRYRYFNLSQVAHSDRQITFDFAKADTIIISCAAGTYNIIFYGTDLDIRNCKVYAAGISVNTAIQMFASSNVGNVNVENCHLTIRTSGDAKIGEQGTFTNCYCYADSRGGHSLLFVPKSDYLIRLIGGTYLSYASASGKTAAIMYTYGTEPDAVIMAQNINCPTVSNSGYFQQYLVVAYAGKTVIDLVTSTMNSDGAYYTITNQIWKSKKW